MRLDPGPAIRASCALIAFAALALPATAAAQKTPSKQPQPQRAPVQPLGSLVQLNGKAGCLVDRSARKAGCTTVRALDGPGPFLGSGAVAVSPDGRHVYVASSSSDAVAIFTRNRTTGKLKQARGTAGCVARKGALGCAKATGLDGPNSLAVSPNGRSVYVTSLLTNAVLSFARNPSTGRLTQVGCVANQALPGCTAGRGLLGPDVVAVSPDSRNVYVGAFRGSTVAAFSRGSSGALEQLDGASGCVASVPIDDCSTALALGAPEGLVVSGDGANLYVANPGANALAVFARDTSSGALTQATDGSGCLANAAIAGCATAVQLAGPDAVAISPDDDQVYVTSLLSNSLTSFDRSASGQLTQKVERELEAMGYRVARNTPYAGGYTTEHYGRRGRRIHALQVEINRALYLDEATLSPTSGFGRLKGQIESLTRALARADWSALKAA